MNINDKTIKSVFITKTNIWNFFIRKDSLEPVLRTRINLIQDGRNDFRKFYQGLENAYVKFFYEKGGYWGM